MPGVGVTYELASGLQMFANIYEAFSPALNGDLAGLQLQQLSHARPLQRLLDLDARLLNDVLGPEALVEAVEGEFKEV